MIKPFQTLTSPFYYEFGHQLVAQSAIKSFKAALQLTYLLIRFSFCNCAAIKLVFDIDIIILLERT